MARLRIARASIRTAMRLLPRSWTSIKLGLARFQEVRIGATRPRQRLRYESRGSHLLWNPKSSENSDAPVLYLNLVRSIGKAKLALNRSITTMVLKDLISSLPWKKARM